MAESDTDPSPRATPVKPGKPSPTFPLFPHANGQWCRTQRINGRKRFFFFGEWATDPKGERAHNLYLAVANDLAAGREPAGGGAKITPPSQITVGEVVDRFLVAQEQRVRDGEIGHREFDDYRRACLHYFLDTIPEHTPVETIATLQGNQRSRWVDQFRTDLAKRVGVYRFNNSLTKIRKMLKWACRTAKLTPLPLYEDEALRKKAKKLVKRDVREREHADGKPVFTAQECRQLVAGAASDGGPLLAFVLLALNAGMGQSHISDLPIEGGKVDTEGLFVDWVRTKTEEICQFPLWPITAIAIERERVRRPKPKAGAEGLLFVTKYGHPWVQEYVKEVQGGIGDVNPDDAIGKAFDKLQKRLGIKRKGRGFYALRRTFSTCANDVQDRDATRRVMGHGLEGMDPHYVRRIDSWRLQRVVSYVGHRLLGCVAVGDTWPNTAFVVPAAPPAPAEPPARVAG